jgi:hypothetical protein
LRIRTLVMGALGLFLSAGLAAACPEVQVAFDPATAGPGDTVHFFSRLANDGTEAITASLDLTISFDDHQIGPFTQSVPLGAGFDHSVEFDFVIPPFAMPGTLGITVAASSDGCPTSTATASLEIVNPLAGGGATPVDAFGQQLVRNGFESPVRPGVEQSTWGEIKAQSR